MKQHAGSNVSLYGYGVPRVGKVTLSRKGKKENKGKTGIEKRRKKKKKDATEVNPSVSSICCRSEYNGITSSGIQRLVSGQSRLQRSAEMSRN